MMTPDSLAETQVKVVSVSPDTEGLWRVYAVDEAGQGWVCRTGNRVKRGETTALVLSGPGVVEGMMLGAQARHARRRMPI
jgi:hypothetical protein